MPALCGTCPKLLPTFHKIGFLPRPGSQVLTPKGHHKCEHVLDVRLQPDPLGDPQNSSQSQAKWARVCESPHRRQEPLSWVKQMTCPGLLGASEQAEPRPPMSKHPHPHCPSSQAGCRQPHLLPPWRTSYSCRLTPWTKLTPPFHPTVLSGVLAERKRQLTHRGKGVSLPKKVPAS